MPRNVSGTYTLPLPPVVPATVIQAAWANTTTDDIAQGITDSLDRQGRGGMIAPFRLVDGSIASPALSFNAETGTGLSRQSAGVLAVSIMGVKVGQFAAAGFTGNLAGPFTVTGAVDFLGSTPSFTRVLFADGTLALPSISFTSDPDTGIYKAGVSELDFAVDAVKRLSMNASSVLVSPSPTASAPSLLVFAGNNAGTSGYAIDMLGSGVGTDKVIVRWLNNGYTIERLSITSDNAQILFSVPGPLPMVFTTNNVTRMTIAAAGQVTFTNDVFGNTFMAAPNLWVGQTTAAAGTVGIQGGLGASTVYWGNTSAGLGAMNLVAGGANAIVLDRVAGAVNYYQMTQSSAGNALLFASKGTDANINIAYVAQGTGAHAFYSNSTSAGQPQFAIQATAGSARNLVVTGSVAGNPTMTASAGLINFGTSTVTTGSAAPPQSGVGTTLTYASSSGLGWIAPGKSANNRVAELYNDTTGFHARWLDDAYTTGLDWLQVVGGQASGTSTINFTTNAAGGMGSVVGSGGFNITALAPGPTSNGLLVLTDTGAAGCNIKMVGDGGTTPKKFMRATAGAWQVLNDGYSAAILGITDGGVLTDNRGLPIVRDPGTAGAGTNPVGSIVFASTGGPTVAAFGTTNAATNNLSVFNTSSGVTVAITSGTWRNIGARDNGTGFALWLRIA